MDVRDQQLPCEQKLAASLDSWTQRDKQTDRQSDRQTKDTERDARDRERGEKRSGKDNRQKHGKGGTERGTHTYVYPERKRGDNQE